VFGPGAGIAAEPEDGTMEIAANEREGGIGMVESKVREVAAGADHEREELMNTPGVCRFEELISTEELLLLPPDDPRVAPVKAVCDRLIQTLIDDSPLSCVAFPREHLVDRVRQEKRSKIVPSARTEPATMPFLPEVRLLVQLVPRRC
jgi:hypothetical protein